VTETRKVAVLAGNRIPFARQDKTYRYASNSDLLTAAIDGLVDRTGLGGQELGEVAAGAVLKHARDWNSGPRGGSRLQAGGDHPGYDLQQACGHRPGGRDLVGNKIALGQIDSAIAGGVDSPPTHPVAVNDDCARCCWRSTGPGPSKPG
jgi:acetyl-CoA C-acetyltransferase